jgi:hypothetical protein
LSAQNSWSAFAGGQPVTLRDGSIIGPGDFGHGTNVYLAKEGGQHWLWTVQGSQFSRRFDLNDAGYLARQNQAFASSDLMYVTRKPWGITLETETAFRLRHWRNLDGLILNNYGHFTNSLLFRNQWRLWTQVQYRAAYFDDREVGDGTALQHAPMRSLEMEVIADPRRALTGNLWFALRRRNNGWWFYTAGTLGLKTFKRLDLELLPTLSLDKGEPRFVERNENMGLLFGRLEARHVGATLRATYSFTSRLTVQVYNQVFLATARYYDFSLFAGTGGRGTAIRLRDLAPTALLPVKNPDLQRAAVNASAVLRWEYRLGSTLYLVYTRSQAPETLLEPGQAPLLEPGVLIGAPAADVFMAKLSYWWG